MSHSKSWFVIINPTSGNGSSKKQWPKIELLLKAHSFEFEFMFTTFPKHSIELVHDVVNQGFKNIISVGGDGTLHNIVNGIMTQKIINPTSISVGVIPIGTGNDWVKTHGIPRNIEKAIQIIKKGKIATQDLGKIKFLNQSKPTIYFNNLAGMGFDGYVVSKVGKYKHFGAMAYLVGTIAGLFSFKNFSAEVYLNSKKISTKSLMVLVGLCKYSGGGMQLTKSPNPFDGQFDISLAGNLTTWDILKNTFKLFNGSIVNFNKVQTFTTNEITIKVIDDTKPFIQTDGELIGHGDISISVVPNTFSFFCK